MCLDMSRKHKYIRKSGGIGVVVFFFDEPSLTPYVSFVGTYGLVLAKMPSQLVRIYCRGYLNFSN